MRRHVQRRNSRIKAWRTYVIARGKVSKLEKHLLFHFPQGTSKLEGISRRNFPFSGILWRRPCIRNEFELNVLRTSQYFPNEINGIVN